MCVRSYQQLTVYSSVGHVFCSLSLTRLLSILNTMRPISLSDHQESSRAPNDQSGLGNKRDCISLLVHCRVTALTSRLEWCFHQGTSMQEAQQIAETVWWALHCRSAQSFCQRWWTEGYIPASFMWSGWTNMRPRDEHHLVSFYASSSLPL